MDISFDAADMELTKLNVNILIRNDSDNELPFNISWQAANVKSSGFSYIGGLAASASSSPLVQSWIVNPDLPETFSIVYEAV